METTTATTMTRPERLASYYRTIAQDYPPALAAALIARAQEHEKTTSEDTTRGVAA